MSGQAEDNSSHGNTKNKLEDLKDAQVTDLWTNGLICAFEFVGGIKKHVKPRSYPEDLSVCPVEGEKPKKQLPTYGISKTSAIQSTGTSFTESPPLMQLGSRLGVSVDDSLESGVSQVDHCLTIDRNEGNHWVPIGWSRISELVQEIQVDVGLSAPYLELLDEEDDIPAADLALPYCERPGGPVWWCHVVAGHPFVDSWLNNAQWLHPAISIALKDESRLISDRMKHLLYEVPVRVAGGLLFELLGQSIGDPYNNEDDIPIVLRSCQSQNFLITALHLKGSAEKINVLGITEVQELLLTGGFNTPRTVHDVIAHLACSLARWDDRLFRKSILGAADEVELMFMNRRTHEDLHLFGIILNQQIRRLSQQVIRVKWSLHAREEIAFELLQHLRGTAAKTLLESIRKSTRKMMEEQEAVRDRLFTIQDVMQSSVRAWLQDRSLRVNHNLAVIGVCGLVLSIITGLFGINVDGFPGAKNTPYAFGLFAGLLFLLGIVLIFVGLIYLGLKKPIREDEVEIRKLELQEVVKMFQHEAETHAQVRQSTSPNNLPAPTADNVLEGAEYVIIH